MSETRKIRPNGESYCRACLSLYNKEYKKKKPSDPSYHREYHLLKRYKLTEQDYDLILKQQNSCCIICLRNVKEIGRKLFVDHDHITGNIRGLLCLNCNSGLGYFKDDINKLNRAVEYLDDSRKIKTKGTWKDVWICQ